ncbi:MAG: hypothetical protein H0W50_11040 [Parachlamydiaceae bacterium]|nr:hypothetical protein [Parachlamydiaceae bacterium]
MNCETNQWQNDTSIFNALRTNLNDKLDVVNGRLKHKMGQNSRASGSSISESPETVADYIESLIDVTAPKIFESLKQVSSNSPEFYEKVADFKRQFKCIYKRTSDLQFTFTDLDIHNDRLAQRYSQVFHKASAFLQQIKQYKSNLAKPPLEERPRKQINYDNRTDLRSIKYSYPKKVPLEETIVAANKALELAQVKPQSMFREAISFIANNILLSPVVFLMASLTVIKIVFWNPFERLIKGKVSSTSPLRWLLDFEKVQSSHMKAYQIFTTQILHCPWITEEVAESFKKLAHHAELLDLESVVLVSRDMRELAPFIDEDKNPGAMPVADYLEKLKKIYDEKGIEPLVSLYILSINYTLYNKLLIDATNSGNKLSASANRQHEDFVAINLTAKYKTPHIANPFIDPKVLKSLLESASSSPTCGKIKISSSLAKLQFVRDFLNKNSYNLKENGEFKKLYSR